jgi:predicted acetyltransferase
MRGVIAQGLAEGAGLSLLFPATSALYRRLGWEHAGHLVRYRLDARHAPAQGAALRPVRPGDWEDVQACHEATGRALNGPAARAERDWARVREARFTYVLDAESGPGIEAYVCFGPRRQPGDWQYSVGFADWGATTPRGVTALLGFVGRHGTIGRDATFGGSFPHPWTFVAPEQDLRRDGGMFWMARALDLPAAVAARGYAPGIQLAVDFRVEDADAPEARGPWRLEVAGGAGKLVPTATADVVLDARAVGPLYTGFTSAAQLALAGVARGPEHDLALLGTAFAGPPPVLFDFF